MSTFVQRMIGAAKLEANTYEEVEHDKSALTQAIQVVVLSAIAQGIGVAGLTNFNNMTYQTISALISWFLWAGITYILGTRLMSEPQTEADMGQMLRTIGFSASPGILSVFGIVPFFGGFVLTVIPIWQLAAMVIAVRQALDYTTTWRAVVVCGLGFIVQMLGVLYLISLFSQS